MKSLPNLQISSSLLLASQHRVDCNCLKYVREDPKERHLMLLMTIVDSLLGVASVCEIKQRKILGEMHLPNLATSTILL